jgi:hypothetical protein
VIVLGPNRVQIWSAQLSANDFPPVCAMTGRPAETWRRFRFATVPGWVYALLLLACAGLVGVVAYVIVRESTARRASGYLPLTRASSLNVALARWLPAGAALLGIALLIGGAVVGISGAGSAGQVDSRLAYTTWVADPRVTGGPEPGYKPAFTGLTGNDIESASAVLDPGGMGWVVDVNFTPRGANLFATLTRNNVAACPGDPNTSSSAACAERHLAVWLNLSQHDIDNWEDPAYVAQVSGSYNSRCHTSGTSTEICPKLVVDAVTLAEIDGGTAIISGGGSGYTRQAADAVVAAIKPSQADHAAAAAGAMATLMLAVGLLVLVGAIIASLVVRLAIGPKAFVMEPYPGYNDKLVELRNLHPAFVAAVHRRNAERAAQHAPAPGSPSLPQSN